MGRSAAWVIKVDESLYASVSQMELVHIINQPELIRIPGVPAYCQNLLIWNDNILPVLNISWLVNDMTPGTGREVVAVLIYRDSRNNIQYGGISLLESPELEYVDNDQVSALPEQAQQLKTIALSCFTSANGHDVPILDISRLFSRSHAKNLLGKYH